MVQGCDLVARSFTATDRAGRKTVRSVVKVTATAIGLCSRYSLVGEATAAASQGGASPRMVQGATGGAEPAAA